MIQEDQSAVGRLILLEDVSYFLWRCSWLLVPFLTDRFNDLPFPKLPPFFLFFFPSFKILPPLLGSDYLELTGRKMRTIFTPAEKYGLAMANTSGLSPSGDDSGPYKTKFPSVFISFCEIRLAAHVNFCRFRLSCQ